jgi:hypothetical protein
MSHMRRIFGNCVGVWDPSRWWRHSLDEQTRSQSSMDDGSGSGSDTPEPSYPSSIPSASQVSSIT